MFRARIYQYRPSFSPGANLREFAAITGPNGSRGVTRGAKPGEPDARKLRRSSGGTVASAAQAATVVGRRWSR